MFVCLDRRIVDEIGYKHTSSHLFHPLYAYPGIQTHFLPPISSTICLSGHTNTLPPTYFVHYTPIRAYKHTSSHLFHPLYTYPGIQTHFLPPISSTIRLSGHTNTLPPTYFIHYTPIQIYKHTSSHLFHPLYAYPDREEVCLYIWIGV